MKIILGTPKSGSTFITRYIANQHPNYAYLKEYFQPLWYDKNDSTGKRLKNLKEKSVFKIHTGKEITKEVWNFIQDREIIFVERKHKLEQYASFGLSYLSNVWTVYDKPNDIIKGYYKKEWFDDLTYRLDQYYKKKNNLKIEKIYYYEDISTMVQNGMLPIKQHNLHINEKLNMFTNKQQFLEWYYDRY
jgi:hypothetical protein